MLLLIYAVKAPLHPRAGPRDPPVGLRAWSWMTAALIFETVVSVFPASPLQRWELLCRPARSLSAVLSRPAAAISPACRRTRWPSRILAFLPLWPDVVAAVTHAMASCRATGAPGDDTRMRRGHCLELPPLGPPRVLMPWSHAHPHGLVLTTDTLYRNRQKGSHYRFFYMSSEMWCLWLFLLLPTPTSGSPWRLSWGSQQHGPLLSTSPQPLCAALALHTKRVFIFNLSSSFAASTWHGWECKRDRCLQRGFSTASSESPTCWMMLMWETALILHAGLRDRAEALGTTGSSAESWCVHAAPWLGQGGPTTVAETRARVAGAASRSSLVLTGSAPGASSSSCSNVPPAPSAPAGRDQARGGGAGASSPTQLSAAARASTPPPCPAPLPVH